ncbi:carbohydrate ABC transporter permease [Brucella anthropi]|uniref:carbohydrate ABC transporter permease n=1 Tax=Brucella anthropi TaxID=529 RepID=UPI001CFF50C8
MLAALIGLSALFTAAVIIVPLISGIGMSFYKFSNFNVTAPPKFVGLDNIIKVASSAAFLNAFKNTLFFTVVSVLIQLVLAVILALALNRKFPLIGAVRTAIILPMLVPTVVIATIDRYITNESFGVLAKISVAFGFEPIGWSTPSMAIWHVIGLGVWLWLPFMVLSLLAELQSIPDSLYEAARVDGANPWQQFFHITLPHLAGVMGIIVLLRGIWTFNNFELIYLTTGGGPVGLTETLPILSYRQSFSAFDIGAGSATSTLSFIFLLVVVVFSYRFLSVNKA